MHATVNAGNNARPTIVGVQHAGPSFARQFVQNYSQPAQPQPQSEGYRHLHANPDVPAALLEAHRLFSQAHAQEIQQVQQTQQCRDRVPLPSQTFAPPPPPHRVPQQAASSSQGRATQAPPARGAPQSQGQPPTTQPPSSNSSKMARPRITVEEAAALRARQIQNVAQQFKSLHTEILKRDAALRDAHARFAKLSQDFAQVQARRQEVEQQCAQLKIQKERAEAEATRVSEHVPKFIAEFCEMRAERDRLAAELAALRDADAPKKDKLAMGAEDINPSFLRDSSEEKKLSVNTEAPYSAPIKNECKAENSPVLSMADHDATVARALAEAHDERKRRQRLEHELEVIKGVLTVASAAIKTSGSPDNVQETLPSMPAPQAETSASQELTTAAEANSSTTDAANQSVNVSRPPSAKLELQGDSMPFWMLPGSELIDLTSVEDNAMQFSGGFMDDEAPEEPERKRALDSDANATQESQPAPKRQKTLDVVPTQTQPAEEGPASGVGLTVASDVCTPGIDAAQDVTMSDEFVTPESTAQLVEPVVSSPGFSTTSPNRTSFSRPSTPSALFGLSLPSPSTAVQLPGQPQEEEQQQLPTPTSPNTPKPLSMLHMPLIFETVGKTLQCRICKRRQAELGTPLYIVDKDTANWDQTAGHCEREHPVAHRMLVKLGPTEIMEERRRLEARSPLAVKVRA